MRIGEARLAVLAIAAAGLGALGASSPASAQSAPSAFAYGVSGVVASHGTATAIKSVGMVQAAGHKAFSRGASVPLFSEALGIVAAGTMIGTAAVVTSGIASHVSSNGTAGATVQVEADTSMASLEITIALVPPPGSTQPAAAPLLSLTANQITAQVTNMRTLPSVAQQTGMASFGSLSLTGGMVGGQTLTFQGDAPANTVLYDDPNMTVSLNHQDVTGAIECTPICQFVPTKMVGDAILIEMFKKPVVDRTAVTGQLVVGQAEAALR